MASLLHGMIARSRGHRHRGEGRMRARWPVLLALAVLLQSLAVQAHLHVSSSARETRDAAFAFGDLASSQASPDQQRDTGQKTSGDDSSTCALCQAHVLGGTALSHVAPTGFAPILSASIAPIEGEAAILLAPVAFHWTGRAPPRV
jgi:hypothetical protein